VRSRISMRPKTEAGRALWQLTRALWDVETTADANRWIKRFHTWEQQYADFLKERSYAPETGRWWYTHRTLRAARSHLRNALPHLFTFTVVPGTPRTSNHVEGGTNARLKGVDEATSGTVSGAEAHFGGVLFAFKVREKTNTKCYLTLFLQRLVTGSMWQHLRVR
jgi:hypothetical protein